MAAKMNRSWVMAAALFLALGSQVAPAHGAKAKAGNAQPATPALVDGNPALQWSANGWSTYISVTEYKGETAFKFPVRHYRGGDGFMYITSTRLIWDPALSADHSDQGFALNADGMTNKGRFGCDFKIDGNVYSFMALFQRGEERDRFPKGVSEELIKGGVGMEFRRWCDASLADFAGSTRQFHDAVGDALWANSPEIRAEQQAFRQQVTAWRAAGSKVDPPDEAQRDFVIAQEAFKDKNFQHQADELEAALKVYPTWPAEQSDLAVILGALGRYSDAIQHMQMYLDLIPDAPDAQRAKQQIWIWQDKLAQSQGVQQQATQAPSQTQKHGKPPR